MSFCIAEARYKRRDIKQVPSFGQAKRQMRPDPFEAYRHVLSQIQEKGQGLQLPQKRNIPVFIVPVLATMTTRLPAAAVLELHRAKKLGIPEETSDILYFLIIKSMLDSGRFTLSRFKRFRKSAEPLLKHPTAEGYRAMVRLAYRNIERDDLKTAQTFLPALTQVQPPRLLRYFLAMFLVDDAVKSRFYPAIANLTQSDIIAEKCVGEAQELAEHAPGQYGHIPALLASWRPEPRSYQAILQELLRLGQQEIGTGTFTLTNLLQHQWFKSSGRTAYLYLNAGISYDEAKQRAKAWEKLLEADRFFVATTVRN